MKNFFLTAGLLMLPALSLHGTVMVDFDGDLIKNTLSQSAAETLSETNAALQPSTSAGYRGPPVFKAFQKEGASLWGAADNAGSGLKLRWNAGNGVAGEASSGLFLFSRADFLNGLLTGTITMNASNDSVSGTTGYINPGSVGPTMAVATATLRLVLKDDTGYHISDAVNLDSSSGFSMEATERSYSAYDPFSNTVTEAGTVGGVSTPSFTNIQFIGFRLDATRGTDTAKGVNMGVRTFSVTAQRELPQSPAQPNVLLICVDDLRPLINSYGETQMFTPNMDGLAASGFQFNRAYVQQAVCSPSRVSMMTGLRPDTTRIFNLTDFFRDTVPWVKTLPQHLSSKGWHSVGFGKIYHGSLNDELSWDEPWSSGSGIYNYATASNQSVKTTYGVGPAFEKADVEDDVYRDGTVAKAAVTKLASLKAQQPFFYNVGFVRPHLPLSAPTKYWDLYETSDLQLPTRDTHADNAPSLAYTTWGELRGYYNIPSTGAVSSAQEEALIHAYYACVSYVDEQIGKLVAALNDEGLAENTIIAVWGDHGYHLGNHGQWTKHTNFERATRVPLIFHVPWKTGGEQLDTIAEILDIYPTIAELCGLELPVHLEGESLKPFMDNPALPSDDHAISQYPRNGQMGYSMRTDQYRYNEWRIQNTDVITARELYDYTADPHEDTNVVDHAAYSAVAGNLAAQLDARLAGLSPFSGGDAVGLVLNGEFDNGLVNWTSSISGSAEAGFEVLPDDGGMGLGADPLLHFAITNGTPDFWTISVEQLVPADSGRRYTLRIHARADADREFRIWWQNKDNAGGSYLNEIIELTTNAAWYEIQNLQLNNLVGKDPDGELRLQAGTSDADVWIDSIQIEALASYTDFTLANSLSGTNAAQSYIDADPDGDQLENLVEYIYNMDPNVSDAQTLTPGTGTSGLPTGWMLSTNESSPSLTLEFLRRRNAYDLSYKGEFSTAFMDDNPWPDSGITQRVSVIDTDWERVEIRDVTDPVLDTDRYGRLKALFTP